MSALFAGYMWPDPNGALTEPTEARHCAALRTPILWKNHVQAIAMRTGTQENAARRKSAPRRVARMNEGKRPPSRANQWLSMD